jgi:formate transporter
MPEHQQDAARRDVTASRHVACCASVPTHIRRWRRIACRGVDCEEREMDYVKPADVAKSMVETGGRKLALSTRDLLIRGILSGAILGVATSLAFNGAFTTGQPLVGAIIFPVGLVMIVLLGLELVTGSFALVPLPFLRGEASGGAVVANWGWVFLGNLIGSVAYGVLIAIALTDMGAIEPAGVAARLVAAAEAKTTGYAAFGFAGLVTVFVKGILCNWMVCLAVVLAMSTTSTIGKIATAWMPVFVFFAQGFEHSVVNMFIIPTGMMLGAKVTVADWWLWNQIPVTLGNLVGGFCFTGFALYWTYKPATAPATEQTRIPATVPAE